jgi:hypothetical protein
VTSCGNGHIVSSDAVRRLSSSISGTLVMFGVADKGGALQGIATIPEGLWELSLGIYCTLKGFRASSPILQASARGDRLTAIPASASA